jgi:hypothetical protein
MIHANLVDSSVFFGVAALTLLLVMFLYAVITADPQEAVRTEAPLTPSPVHAPPPLPVRGTQAFAPPVFPTESGRPAGTDYAATRGAAASVTSRPEVSRGSPRRPAVAFLFLIAGLALAVIGGGMFFGTGQDVTVCTNQVLAICSDGFVVLHTAQLLGGALAIGGIGLVSTAVVLALR